MGKVKILNAEEIDFEEVGAEWVNIKLGDEKFTMDMDTLIDLSFRCASFLAYVEGKEDSAMTCTCKTVH